MTIMGSPGTAGTAAAKKAGAGPARPRRRLGTARRGRARPSPRLATAALLAAALCGSLAAGGGSLPAPAGRHVPGGAVRLVSADRPVGRAASPASGLLRYVALGDSVPYGHGLANPSNKSQSGLPPDQGPSPLAWPSLVDKGLPSLAPLTLRKKGCTLTGDQLAISGAPVQVNKWTGKDTDCYPKISDIPVHKAVVPNEINTADLKADPPALVTIQAGADDIDFAGCLTALLLPGFGDPCVTHGKYGYLLTAKALAEMQSAKVGLKLAIADILAAAPNAQILLVDYYQIIPAASTHVQGTSAICDGIGLFGQAKRTYVRGAAEYVQARLNGAISAAAQGNPNVAVVDIAPKFSKHEMCTKQPWVFSSPTWRVGHPTKKGQSVIAQAVISFCKGTTLKNHCLGHPASSGWTATQAPEPAGGSWGSLNSVTCPSDSSCTAVGQYTDSSEISQGLLVTGRGTSWAATEAPPPADPPAIPGVYLGTVACPSASSCTAAGGYTNSSFDEPGLLVTGSGTSWSASVAPLPAGASTTPFALLDTVACPSPSACTAAGEYTDSSEISQGLLLTGSGTTWTATKAPLPAAAAADTDPQVDLNSAACASTSSCTAVGYYFDSAGDQEQEGLLLTGSGTSWTATKAPLPADADTDHDVILNSVVCPSASSCTVAGEYAVSPGSFQGLLLTGSGTSWTATKAPLPAGGDADYDVYLNSVACPSASSCTAVGYYTDSAGNQEGLLLTGSGTSWTATEAPLPAHATPDVDLNSVACPSAGLCTAVGEYFNNAAGNQQGLLLTGSGTSWTAAEASLPADADTAPGVYLNSVACPSAGPCMVAGEYDDSAGTMQGLLETGSG